MVSGAAVETLGSGRQLQMQAVSGWQLYAAVEDFGGGQLIQGRPTVKLDPIFAETVSTELEYHVFLYAQGRLQAPVRCESIIQCFEVRELQPGTSTIDFDYRVVAKRKGYEHDDGSRTR
jgi:hypothetical protein